jgi:hypothetical protein
LVSIPDPKPKLFTIELTMANSFALLTAQKCEG